MVLDGNIPSNLFIFIEEPYFGNIILCTISNFIKSSVKSLFLYFNLLIL